MRRTLPALALAGLCLFLAGGCAQVRPETDFGAVSDIAQQRLGQRPYWVQTPQNQAWLDGQVRAMLERGLTPEDAARLALINSPAVQARFEDIGAARADVVQAGLPRNPSLGVLLGFPLFSGGPLASLAAQAMLSISDLAEIKDRTAKAQAELEREVLLVARDATEAAREAKLAWLELAYARRAVDACATVAAKAAQLERTTRHYTDFGLADEARAAAIQAGAARATLEVSRARSRAAVAQARLERATGLPPGGALTLAPLKDAAAPAPLPDPGKAVAYAQANSLEAQAARHALKAARSGVELEKLRWLKDFQVGAEYAYDIEGNRTMGPGASLALPLFDANQAQRAKAAFRVRQAERLEQQARHDAAERARRALEDADLARATAEGLARGVLPPAERAAAWAGKYARAMQLSELEWLETELSLLKARLEHNQALLEQRQALVNLEHALGGPIPGLSEQAPATGE